MLNKLGVGMIILLIAILMLPRSACAYLDPGTGGMLFSAFIGIVATLLFVCKSLIFKIKHLPSYISGEKIKRTNHECERIVFYSEGGLYWYVFKPVIEELYNRRICCTYVSGDENDPGNKSENIHGHVDFFALFPGIPDLDHDEYWKVNSSQQEQAESKQYTGPWPMLGLENGTRNEHRGGDHSQDIHKLLHDSVFLVNKQ